MYGSVYEFANGYARFARCDENARAHGDPMDAELPGLFLLSPITDPALAGPLESLPTTIMTTGGCDHLDFRFARRLREAGVPVLHRVERPGSSAAQVISAITDDLDRFLRRSRSRYGEPAAQTWSEREAMVAESRR
jgi:hypothetical protein